MMLNVSVVEGGCEGRGSGEEKGKGHFKHKKLRQQYLFVCLKKYF